MLNYRLYHRMLELLATIKIGVILVELAKTASDDDQQPLELLAELFHTLLHAVRNDHPQEILELVEQAIEACIEEYEGESVHHTMPIPLLDELLLCLGQGPTQWAVNTNPQAQGAAAAQAASAAASKIKKNKKNKNQASATGTTSNPMFIEQPNPSFLAAAAIMRKYPNRLATPVSQLLNGLLNGDAHIVERSLIQSAAAAVAHAEPASSSRADDSALSCTALPWPKDSVYTIVYELHRVVPQVLTTVIGTLSKGLSVPDATPRGAVVDLLGRMFATPPQSGKPEDSLAWRYHACFRDWINRQNDIHVPIRQLIVKYCVLMQKNRQQHQPQSPQSQLQDRSFDSTSSGASVLIEQEITATLLHLTTTDPSLDVRLDAILAICDWAFKRPQNGNGSSNRSVRAGPPAALLQAVGSRVRSKNKTERRDAITGLAQIYFRFYITPKLSAIQAGGDDCNVGVILEAMRSNCQLNDRYGGGGGHGDSCSSRRGRSNGGSSFRFDDADDENQNEAHELYGWIPRLVFESACFTDSADAELRSRVIQIVDDVLMGSDLSSSKSKRLSPTARAVGLTIILDSLAADGESLLTEAAISSTNAFKMFRQLFVQRANLQIALGNYVEARAKAKECATGSFCVERCSAVICSSLSRAIATHSII